MKRTTFLLAAVAVAIVGAGVPVTIRALTQVRDFHHSVTGTPGQAGIKTLATYKSRPPTVQEMTKLADAVVVVTAGNASAGRAVPVDQGGTSYLTLQFELVDFVINQVLKGGVVGALTLERVSDLQNGSPVISHHDGGRFLPGASYLLFLQRQPESSYYILINDEARFVVGPNGVLNSSGAGPVASRLRGEGLAVAIALVRQSLGAQ